MCIFSGPVNEVSKTNLFARWMRHPDGARQVLVYSMDMAANSEVAMILPIPVKENKDDAVSWVNLQGYPNFFADMVKGFPEPQSRGISFGMPLEGLKSAKSPLVVHQVGDFEASFVPSHQDWDRLDSRFQLIPTAWNKLPQYTNYGFAVFKLNQQKVKKPTGHVFGHREPSQRPSGHVLGSRHQFEAKTIHPMAFVFSNPEDYLYFPTVHIHDGADVPSHEKFDHSLYFQGDGSKVDMARQSIGEAKSFMDMEKAQKVLRPDSFVYRIRLEGMMENQDVWVGV